MSQRTSTVRARSRRLSSRTLAYVALEDAAWLAVLVPVGLAFQGLLVLARGFYACRRRGAVWGALYVGAVVGVIGWLFAAALRARRTRR